MSNAFFNKLLTRKWVFGSLDWIYHANLDLNEFEIYSIFYKVDILTQWNLSRLFLRCWCCCCSYNSPFIHVVHPHFMSSYSTLYAIKLFPLFLFNKQKDSNSSGYSYFICIRILWGQFDQYKTSTFHLIACAFYTLMTFF